MLFRESSSRKPLWGRHRDQCEWLGGRSERCFPGAAYMMCKEMVPWVRPLRPRPVAERPPRMWVELLGRPRNRRLPFPWTHELGVGFEARKGLVFFRVLIQSGEESGHANARSCDLLSGGECTGVATCPVRVSCGVVWWPAAATIRWLSVSIHRQNK